MSAIDVQRLRVLIDGRAVVDDVTLSVAAGESLAIVGESGAGKSMIAHALLGLSPSVAAVSAESLRVDGVELRGAGEADWRQIRGSRIALISQDALVSLDPFRTIGREIEEPLEIHTRDAAATRRTRVEATLDAVAMPDARRRMGSYPHQLSGGLRQRALIASALVTQPAIVIADEPTTALDATVQLRILRLLREIVDAGTSLLVITHDLAAAAHLADRIAVVQAGKIVELGRTSDVLENPQHPHTRELVEAWGIEPAPRPAPSGSEILVADRVSKSFPGAGRVVDDVSITLRRGETVGVAGESGSGKTTLGRILMGVEVADAGTVTIGGERWNPAPESDRRAKRHRIQMVHQNPRAAFNPRWTIARSLAEALAAGGVPRGERAAAAAAALAQVELDPSLAKRRPGQLSGGQRQRAAIARALAVRPEILVLDEPVSALDASVQVTVLALLDRLQRETGVAMMLISHDLRVLAAVADELLIMRDGHVVEAGPTAQVFVEPRHPFTKSLLAAASLGAPEATTAADDATGSAQHG